MEEMHGGEARGLPALSGFYPSINHHVFTTLEAL
jgi:hypothetical protein